MAAITNYNSNNYDMIFDNKTSILRYDMIFNPKNLFSCDNANIEDIVQTCYFGYIENTIEDIKKDLKAKVETMIVSRVDKNLNIFEGIRRRKAGFRKVSSEKILGTYFYR